MTTRRSHEGYIRSPQLRSAIGYTPLPASLLRFPFIMSLYETVVVPQPWSYGTEVMWAISPSGSFTRVVIPVFLCPSVIVTVCSIVDRTVRLFNLSGVVPLCRSAWVFPFTRFWNCIGFLRIRPSRPPRSTGVVFLFYKAQHYIRSRPLEQFGLETPTIASVSLFELNWIS